MGKQLESHVARTRGFLAAELIEQLKIKNQDR
jgi:hypothetical protein